MNIYENCPVYETNSFRLRLVRPEDARALLVCYSDPAAVSKINSDHCTSDFYYRSVEEMEECIAFWLKEYGERKYVRFALIPRDSGSPVGTMEVFGGDFGVLRMDIAAAYDREAYIEELLRLAVLRLIRDFQIKSLKIKSSNTPERIPLLKKYGFVPSETFYPELGYYERPATKYFDPAKGMGFCGLACCLCRENKTCPGCKNKGCPDQNECQNYNCCQEKGLKGCWACADFPCRSDMLQKLRVRAFGKYMAQKGSDRLMAALKNNEEQGVLYHYEGQLTGDYDLLQSETEIFQFLDRGL